jgi:hypothetical protein
VDKGLSGSLSTVFIALLTSDLSLIDGGVGSCIVWYSNDFGSTLDAQALTSGYYVREEPSRGFRIQVLASKLTEP